jgi:hypothetical protein
MAKFFLTPKGLIARFPWVQTPAWMVEAGVFYLMLGFAHALWGGWAIATRKSAARSGAIFRMCCPRQVTQRATQ